MEACECEPRDEPRDWPGRQQKRLSEAAQDGCLGPEPALDIGKRFCPFERDGRPDPPPAGSRLDSMAAQALPARIRTVPAARQVRPWACRADA